MLATRFSHNECNEIGTCVMTREEWDNLKEGDKIIRVAEWHPQAPEGWVTIVTMDPNRTHRPLYVTFSNSGYKAPVNAGQWDLVSKQKREPKGFAAWVKKNERNFPYD